MLWQLTMRIGVDLGGTKIEILALADDGAELLRRRCATPAQEGYEAIVAAIVTLVTDAEAELRTPGASVGVGTPGAMSPASGRMKNANTTCLIGKPLGDDLTAALRRRVWLANDANCFALSEATDGAAAGADVVFGVIVGTGTGGGLVVRGAGLTGANAIAGEWGHMPLPWPRDEERPGPPCYCGKRGCIETFLSGPALARDHEVTTGAKATGREIVAAADAGQADARATLERYIDRMARGLAVVIDIVDPDVIVLGGGLSNIAALYEAVPARLPRYVFTDGAPLRTRVVQAKHGDSSGVRGAAWLPPS